VLGVRADPGSLVRTHTGWLVAVVAVIGTVAVVLMPGGAADPSAPLRAVAVYVILLAAVLLTPALLAPLARVLGLPFAAVLRLEERLARAAIRRDPSRTALTVGVAFDEQVVDALPLEEHDTPVDLVVTPTRTLRRR